MGKNQLDFKHGSLQDESVGKFSFWIGLLSIPSSIVLLGIPLGIIAYVMGGKVLVQNKTRSDVGGWGKATLGRFFGGTGIFISVIWGLYLLGNLIIDWISDFLK